jgi:FK506-binding protein 4/5
VACKKYKTITEYLKSTNYEHESDKKKAHELTLTTHSNMALCHLKLGEHAECIRACDKALELDPKNEKCLFRRGQSYMSMSSFEEAIKDFQEVLKLNAANTAANQHIQTCREHLKVYQQKEKQLYANIFAKMAKTNEKVNRGIFRT